MFLDIKATLDTNSIHALTATWLLSIEAFLLQTVWMFYSGQIIYSDIPQPHPKQVAEAYSTTPKNYCPQCSCFYFLKVIENQMVPLILPSRIFACIYYFTTIRYHHRLHISCWFLWDQKASRSQRNGQSLRVWVGLQRIKTMVNWLVCGKNDWNFKGFAMQVVVKQMDGRMDR